MKYVKRNIHTGTLFVVATPIGNLQDITYRAINTLKKSDIIAAENILHAHVLLKEYGLKKRIISFNKINEKKKSYILIEHLNKGNNLSLISKAGTPTVNDPGNYLIKLCYKCNITIITIPGPCSAISALSISGISYDRFIYEGFLPKKKLERIVLIKNFYLYQKRTIIFNEAPNRVLETIKDIYDIYADKCFIVIAKELTKIWESVYRGLTSEIINMFITKKIEQKGEFVILLIIDSTIPIFLINDIKYTINLIKNFLNRKKCIELIKMIYKIKKKIIKILYNK